MRKTIFVLLILLVLSFTFTLVAFAKQPTETSGFFYFVPPFGPRDYCIATGEEYTPDGFIAGCVDQPEKPGIGVHGTIQLTIVMDGQELTGACKYNLRSYDIDGIARFVANRCTGDLAGFHMKAVGWASNALWKGTYHFKP